MVNKNGIANSQVLTIAGGLISIISVFLPWFSARATAAASGEVSTLSVNGLGTINGSGMLLGLVSGKIGWEFQGIGVLALGIASIAVALLLREKLQSIAMSACGLLIIGGGVVNLVSIESFSGDIMGATIVSGIGYGLYVVVIAGAVAVAGGIFAWRDINR
ncbi:MAG: hypothetical protein WC568_03660 [Candidatus Methanoperedens sp.]